MQPLRFAITLFLVPGLLGAAVADGNPQTGGKRGTHPVHGKVVSIQKNAGAGTGTLTIMVHHHHKKGSTTTGTPQPNVEKTFTITAGTKFELISGKKGNVTRQDAGFANLQQGQHVLIFHSGTEATDVKIVQKGKKSI